MSNNAFGGEERQVLYALQRHPEGDERLATRRGIDEKLAT